MTLTLKPSSGLFLGCALALAMSVPTGGAQAKGFEVLYSFMAGSDGAYPQASLMRDQAGNLYGTTQEGGANNAGTVFRLAPGGTESVLHSFGGTGDGADPTDNLVADKAANLYGTTEKGGGAGAGTIFKLAPDGSETVLYSFSGGRDGGNPLAGVIRKSGDLFGTTEYGGAEGHGVVFRLARDGTETVLHHFRGGSDGAFPLGGLIADRAGNLYGTAYQGGAHNLGTVYEIAPDGTETVLHSFAHLGDGHYPAGALVADASGNLYGTTVLGGASDAGTVFRLEPNGTESVLYSFTGGSVGAGPTCTLLLDAAGNLYGTTPTNDHDGNGAVFRLAPDGTASVLHSFTGAGGAAPYPGLIADSKGHLYGTTQISGTYGYGTVFRLDE